MAGSFQWDSLQHCWEWPGNVTIVYGWPRNPKCDGLVEQGNHMVGQLLGVQLHDYNELHDCNGKGDYAPGLNGFPAFNVSYDSQGQFPVYHSIIHRVENCKCVCMFIIFSFTSH